MEYDIVTILNNAGAADYIPNFARHHISIETLIQMSDNDLVRVSCFIRSFLWPARRPGTHYHTTCEIRHVPATVFARTQKLCFSFY